MSRKHLSFRETPGFTLVELSVILVVIALIIGGIMVGKDLMRAATVHRSVSQINELQTSVKLFQARYNALPGDFNNAAKYWSGAYNGDGDRRISGGLEVAGGPHMTTSYECYNVWNHLHLSGLYPLRADPVNSNLGAAAPALPGVMDKVYLGLHHDTIGGGNEDTFITMTSTKTCLNSQGLRGLLLGIINPVFLDAPYRYASPRFNLLAVIISDAAAFVPVEEETGADVGILPADAGDIDKKMDDGLPVLGFVRSALLPMSENPAKDCINSRTEYDTSSQRLVCGLWIRLNGLNQ